MYTGNGRLAEDVLLMMTNRGIQPSDTIANDFLICYERMAKVFMYKYRNIRIYIYIYIYIYIHACIYIHTCM
jgi:hypothetical protein